VDYRAIFTAPDDNTARLRIAEHIINEWSSRVGRPEATRLLCFCSEALMPALSCLHATKAKALFDQIKAFESVIRLGKQTGPMMESRGVQKKHEAIRGRIFPPIPGFPDADIHERVAAGDAVLDALAACEEAVRRVAPFRQGLRERAKVVNAKSHDDLNWRAVGRRAFVDDLAARAAREPILAELLDGGVVLYWLAAKCGVEPVVPKDQDEVNQGADRWRQLWGRAIRRNSAGAAKTSDQRGTSTSSAADIRLVSPR
jgi:hypothetical protein